MLEVRILLTTCDFYVLVMGDVSRALPEDLLKELECPVCMQYMVPPIKLCANGHNICSKCRGSIRCCPTCRAEFLVTRNVALENIIRKQEFPCANRQSGCLELLSIEHIAEHRGVCVYETIICPCHLFNLCSWNGLKNNLKEHAKEAHSKITVNEPTFLSSALSSAVAFVSHFGELFMYHKRKKDGRYYCAVQLMGTRSEAAKYKCDFTLRAANGIEQIRNTFLVQGYSEDWETSFNSGKCLRLDEATLRNFLVGSKLDLTVTLSTVRNV
jgi:hypothetical protein